MAYLTTQTVDLGGADPTYESAGSSGDTFTPSDRTYFHVKNESASSVTVMFDDPNSEGPSEAYSFDPDVYVVVEPSGERMVGPIGSSRFANSSDNYAHVTYSSSASVTVGVFSLSAVTL